MTEVLDAVDFGVIRIAPDGQVAVTNDAHGRLQQAIRSESTATMRERRERTCPRSATTGRRRCRPTSCRSSGPFAARRSTARSSGSASSRGHARRSASRARRLTDSAGQDAGAVVVSRDVTTELNALRARDELVASVSHELRTPLTSILGYLDLAIEDPDLPDHLRGRTSMSPSAMPSACSASSATSSRRRARRLVGRGVAHSAGDRCARDRPRVRGGSGAARVRAGDHDRHGRARGGVRVGGSAASASGRRQPALERHHVQPGRRHRLPGYDQRRHLELDPRARHRCGHDAKTNARGCSSASTRPAPPVGRARDSVSRSAATSSARTAASSACTARPASDRPSSSNSLPPNPDWGTRHDPRPRPLQRPGDDRGRRQRQRRALHRRDASAPRRRSGPHLGARIPRGHADDARVRHLGADTRGLVGDRGRQRRVRRGDGLHVARMPAIQWSADGMVVRRRGGRSGRGGDLRLRGGSGRGRLGGCAVDVHPPAGIRRRSGRSSACVASFANRARRGCSAPCSLFQSLYYLSRTTAFLTSGPDSSLFQNAFGTIPTSFVTVTLTIVAVVVTSVLRASRAPMRGHLQACGLRHGARRNPLAGRLRRRDVGPLRTRAVALGAGRRDRGADRRPRADLDRVRQRGRPRRDGDLAHGRPPARAVELVRRRGRTDAGCWSGCSSSHRGRRGGRRR